MPSSASRSASFSSGRIGSLITSARAASSSPRVSRPQLAVDLVGRRDREVDRQTASQPEIVQHQDIRRVDDRDLESLVLEAIDDGTRAGQDMEG